MNIPDVHGELLLQMPAWNALYEIRDFSSRIQRLEGTADSQPLSVEKIDKQTWRIYAKGQTTVHYAIYWDTAGPFASQLNEEHAFVNPAMVLMYVPDRRNEAAALSFHDIPTGWTTS